VAEGALTRRAGASGSPDRRGEQDAAGTHLFKGVAADAVALGRSAPAACVLLGRVAGDAIFGSSVRSIDGRRGRRRVAAAAGVAGVRVVGGDPGVASSSRQQGKDSFTAPEAWCRLAARVRRRMGRSARPQGQHEVLSEEDFAVAQGSVKWFSNEKGYGFIEREDGDDLFVHYSEITMDGYKTLVQGQRVEFEITEGDKGLQASTVKPIA
jgi:cold shock protein